MECYLYTEAKQESRINICTKNPIEQLKQKSSFYYFQIKKVNTLPTSSPFLLDNEYFIDLTWHNVKKYASILQIEKIDKFRRAYVKFLLESFCNKKTLCKYERTGKVTPLSDIDINIEKNNIKNIMFKYDLHEIVKDIYHLHFSLFKHDLEKLFDINIYAAIFKLFDKTKKQFYIPEYKTNYQQRIWACLRFVQVLQHHNLFHIIVKKLFRNNDGYTKLLYDTDIKIKYLENKYSSNKSKTKIYIKILEKYYNIINQNKKIQSIIKIYSLCKYLENDAYHSAGAYLHIVANKQNLNDNILYDSIYDNLGFLVESFFKHSEQATKLEKLAKYLSRIFDAMIKMKHSVLDYETVNNGFIICNNVMEKKKKLKDNFVEKKMSFENSIHEFKKQINALLNRNQNKAIKFDILIDIINLIFNKLLKHDPLI
jgi:hypothetical protein